MKLVRCSYVSSAGLEALAARGGIEAIVVHASTFNRTSEITGALVYSGTRFAQILEGPSDAMGVLIERIRTDDRHAFEAELGAEEIGHREFKHWSMCYAGPSLFVARTIADFAKASDRGRPAAGRRLLAMIAGLARSEA